MSPGYDEFRRHEEALIRLRQRNQGRDSREEDALLEIMDAAWWQLTDAERQEIDAEVPRSWIEGAALQTGTKIL